MWAHLHYILDPTASTLEEGLCVPTHQWPGPAEGCSVWSEYSHLTSHIHLVLCPHLEPNSYFHSSFMMQVWGGTHRSLKREPRATPRQHKLSTRASTRLAGCDGATKGLDSGHCIYFLNLKYVLFSMLFKNSWRTDEISSYLHFCHCLLMSLLFGMWLSEYFGQSGFKRMNTFCSTWFLFSESNHVFLLHLLTIYVLFMNMEV